GMEGVVAGGGDLTRKFVSEAELDEKRKKRQEEWEQVRKPDDPEEVPEEDYDHRCLFERLQEQKDKKQEDFEEQFKFKNMVKGLDEDESHFLDEVSRQQSMVEKQRRDEEKKELLDLSQSSDSGKKPKVTMGSAASGQDSSGGGGAQRLVLPSASVCVGVLPGLGLYSGSSDSESSSDSEGGSAVRWNFKSRAVHAIHEGRVSLCIAFDKIMTEPGWDKETIAQSASLKQKLEDFEFTFLLGVFQFIFGLTEPLFQVLQSKTVDIKKCQDRIMSTLSALKATRTDEAFSRIYDETGTAVGEPVPRRKRRRRGWDDLEQGFNQHQEGDQETLVSFRRLYFQIVDGVVLHMTHRFADMEHLNFFRILEHTSFASFCKPAAFPSSELAQLINTYPFFDQLKLRNELHTLYNNRLFHKPPGQLIELLIEDDLQGTLSEASCLACTTTSTPGWMTRPLMGLSCC
ncbi:hypothetical protein NHX12_003204, partial [Muraenolepis orangiensis]